MAAPRTLVMQASLVRTGRDDRRKAIIDVAREVFRKEGYAAASMASIAARVGGSKGTLYNYFPSKELLFAALIQSECEVEVWSQTALKAQGGDVEGCLREFGLGFVTFALGEKAMSLHRLVIAESSRFPELGRAFFENGPRESIARVARWLEMQTHQGRLQIVDFERAATQFLDLCKCGLHQRLLWNVEPHPSQEAIAANVDAAVRVFMAAYGPAVAGSR